MFKIIARLSNFIFLFKAAGLLATVIPITDKNVISGLSPYNWVCRDGFISSSVNGASLTVKFNGTSQVSIQVDTDHMIFESPLRFPIISWTVNGGPVQSHQLAANESLVLLSSEIADPVIDLYIKGMSPIEDRFTGDFPPNAVKFAGFKVDAGGSVLKVKLPGKVWLTFGDSILSGDGAALTAGQGRPEDDLWAASDEARASYSYLLAKHLGYREGRIAYGGYDWGGGMADVPALSTLIDSTTSTVSRLHGDKLDPLPDVVLINLGENGAPADHDVIVALDKLRSRVSKDSKIIVMIPVSGRARTEVTRAFNTYKTNAKDDNAHLIDLGFFGYNTGDGQHPTAMGHQTIFKAALPAFDAILRDQYHSPSTMQLWEGVVPESEGRPAGENAFITVYRPANPNGAAVVICPGGGYGMLVSGPEGQGIAQWLNQKGITGIVLEYRLPKGNSNVPLLDVQQAIRMVRSRARDWGIDPNRIGIMGFSAGGHLASTAATHFDAGDRLSSDIVARCSSRPDFAILVYPVITMGPKTHGGSKKNLLGPDPTGELVTLFSNEQQVTDQTPPTFIAHAMDDDVVSPDNSQMLYDALKAHQVPAAYLKLKSGGHGLNGYSGPMWDEWQTMSMNWLVKQKIVDPFPIGLDVKAVGPVISPLLFGHNLEVTRKGIWSGLSAQMVANRKFAAVSNGQPQKWQAIGTDGSVRIDTTVVYAGKQSAQVYVSGNDAPAGLCQRQEQLSFKKNMSYRLRVWVKTKAERQLRLRLTGEATKPVFDRSFSCKPGEWQLINAEFVASATLFNHMFEITSKEQGTFWIGAVSVLPSDAFHGMRRDVIELLKSIKPGILRFPGGCYAEFYSWKDGLLPVDQRPPIANTGLDFLFRDTDGTDTQEIGIDEFMALCREVGCEPAITARLSDNLPDDAASWVEYCNGDASAGWGSVRAQRGHKEPYDVQWWFVGNEIAYFGRGKAGGVAGCAEQSLLFAEAMNNADPKIRLVPSTFFVNGKSTSEWNTPLLESLGKYTQAVSVHQYILDQLPLKTADDYSAIIKAPVRNTLPLLTSARDFIHGKQPYGVEPGITYDEWNTLWGNQGTVPMGLYVANMLNLICREAQPLGLKMACYFMPVNEGAIKVSPLSAELDAAGLVFDMYKIHQGNRLLQIPKDENVDLCASLTPNGNRICLTAVNDITGEQIVTFSLAAGTKAKSSSVLVDYLIPRSLEINETVFTLKEEKLSIIDDLRFKLCLPPGAIARVTIELHP
jgi:alpha-L-arabinofuranosidase/acetyl esterase/lipase